MTGLAVIVAVVGQPGTPIPRRVINGGSLLSAPNYCLRYRPSARQAEAVDTSTQHIGFRCIAGSHGPDEAGSVAPRRR